MKPKKEIEQLLANLNSQLKKEPYPCADSYKQGQIRALELVLE